MPINYCPVCKAEQLYALADGRLRCAECRAQFRPAKSIWDSFRLAPEIKDRLVDLVVKGLPTNSPEVRDLSSRPTRDRFSRLALACYAHDVGLRSPIDLCIPVANEPSVDPRHWPRRRTAPRSAVVFKLSERKGKVRVQWIGSKRGADVWRETAPNTGPGLPRFDDERHAYVWFAVQGERVGIPKSRRPRKRLAPASATERVTTPAQVETSPQSPPALIERFWKYFLERLRHHNSVARKDLHLYLGEACYRFNKRHRTDTRHAMLVDLMKRRSVVEVESVLSR